MTYSRGKAILPSNIKGENDYNVKNLVLKQIDRINLLLSIYKANTQGVSENHRALAFGVKSALLTLEAMLSPFIKPKSKYFVDTDKIQKELTRLEKTYAINSNDFRYWFWLNRWYGYLIKELHTLGYFPTLEEEQEGDLSYD
jgi:hypothetical protein